MLRPAFPTLRGTTRKQYRNSNRIGGPPLGLNVLIRVFSPLVTLTLTENHVIDQRRRYACSQFAPISSLTFKNRETNEKPQGEPPSCVIWRNPCQEAWYFALWTPTMCALIVLDGSVGLDPVDIDPRHIKFRRRTWEDPHCFRSKTKRDGQTGGLMRIESIQAPLSQSQPRFDP